MKNLQLSYRNKKQEKQHIGLVSNETVVLRRRASNTLR